MSDIVVGTLEPVLHAERRKRREPTVHGNHRQAVSGNALVWFPPDGPLHAATGPQVRSSPRASPDAAHAVGADLPNTEHQQKAPTAQDLAVSAEGVGDHSRPALKPEPGLASGWPTTMPIGRIRPMAS